MANEDSGYSVELPLSVVEEGRIVLGISLFLTVYFNDAHGAKKREGVLDCLQDYIAMCGDKLTFWSDTKARRWTPFSPTLTHEIRDEVLGARPEEAWQFLLHGGRTTEEASYFEIKALGRRDWQSREGELSF